MRFGVHMPNQAITKAHLDLFALGKFKVAKLMWLHKPTDVPRLKGVGCVDFILRVPDSRLPDGRILGFNEYASICAGHINAFYDQGVKVVQVDNEPNIVWGGDKAWPYQAFLRNLIPTLRTMIPADVRLAMAPLSFAPALFGTLNTWRDALLWKPTEVGLLRAIDYFDLVSANVYWQSARQMIDPSFGRAYETVHGWFGKNVIVTEFGNSALDSDTPPTLQDVRATRMKDYPQWAALASTQQYVEAACCFILGGTPDWWKFNLTECDCLAMRG